MTNSPQHIDFCGKTYDKPSLMNILGGSVFRLVNKILLIESVKQGVLTRRDITSELNMSPTEYLLWLDAYNTHQELSGEQTLGEKKVLHSHPKPSEIISDQSSVLYRTTKKVHETLIHDKGLPEKSYLRGSEFTKNELMILQTLSMFAGKVVPNNILYGLTQIDKDDIATYGNLKVFMSRLNAKLSERYKIMNVKGRGFRFENVGDIELYLEIDALTESIIQASTLPKKKIKSKLSSAPRDPNQVRSVGYLRDLSLLKPITRKEAFLLFEINMTHKNKMRLMRAILVDKVISKDDLMIHVGVTGLEYKQWYDMYKATIPKSLSEKPTILELEDIGE